MKNIVPNSSIMLKKIRIDKVVEKKVIKFHKPYATYSLKITSKYSIEKLNDQFINNKTRTKVSYSLYKNKALVLKGGGILSLDEIKEIIGYKILSEKKYRDVN